MKYFKILSLINKKIMYDKFNIRYKEEELKEIYNLLDSFFNKEFNLNSFLELSSLLFTYQIFSDGNSRTILEFMNIILKMNNYHLDLESIKKDFKILKCYFPIIYYIEEEKPSKNELNNMKKYIKKVVN